MSKSKKMPVKASSSRQVLSTVAGMTASAIMSLGAVVSAHASDYVRADFQGAVTEVNADTPADITVGTPIYWDVVFDLDKLTNYTDSVNDATGLGFSSVLAATLANDNYASLTVTVGSISFTKYDQENYGTPEGDAGPGGNLGIGNFPTVMYLDGSFSGIGNILINKDNYSIDADPIADAFGGFDLGSGNGGSDFMLSKASYASDGSPIPFSDPFAVGNYDAASVVITSAAPEPQMWALMFGGVAIAGGMLRIARMRRRGDAASSLASV